MKNILLLFGGNSYEHEISCLSARNIYNYIDKNIFNIFSCYVSKDNKYYIFNNDFDNIDVDKLEIIDNIIDYLKKFDCIFNIIHGNDGEDGKLQALFEMFDISYVGPDHTASMISMNKLLTKIYLNNYHIKQTKYVLFDNNIDTIEKKLNYPMIVKPAGLGSSIGINKVDNQKELLLAIKIAKNYDNDVIVEEFIYGLELECAVLENDHNIHVSNIGQIKPYKEFYDYEDKYLNNKTKTLIPALISKKISNKIKKIAKKVFKILNCKDLARIDFLYDDKNDIIYFNEVNTLPGFTNISMYPMLLEFDGYSYKNIITILINNNINLLS